MMQKPGAQQGGYAPPMAGNPSPQMQPYNPGMQPMMQKPGGYAPPMPGNSPPQMQPYNPGMQPIMQKPGAQQGGYAPPMAGNPSPQMQPYNPGMPASQYQKPGAAPGFNPSQVQRPPVQMPPQQFQTGPQYQQTGNPAPFNPQMIGGQPQFQQFQGGPNPGMPQNTQWNAQAPQYKPPLPQPQMLQCPCCNQTKLDHKFYTDTHCESHGNISCCLACIGYYQCTRCPYCGREFSENERMALPALISSLGTDL
jgi:hypothetical protein